MKNIKRYIPIEVNKFLKNKLHTHIVWNRDLSSDIISLDYEGLVIACDTILRVSGSREVDKNNLCQIQKDCFTKILHNNYKLYLDYLIDNRIIITDNQYIVGEKSISYKINEEYIGELITIIIDNDLFNKRTLSSIKSNSRLKISKDHQNNFKSSFKIDYDGAIQKLINDYLNKTPDHKGRVLNKYTKTLLQHKLLQIKDGQLWINRSDSNGRVNSNLSTLNSDYKQFILGYGFSLDIVSSQPLLLNILFDLINSISSKTEVCISSFNLLLSYVCKIVTKTLTKKDAIRFLEELKSVDLPSLKEMNLWKKLTQKGEIYEFFQREIYNKLGKKLSRFEVKQLVITNLYSSNYNQSEYKKLFSSIFPSIFKFMTKMKSLIKMKRSHRMLPIIMQGIESHIWVDGILPKLDKLKIKYLFIHDSILIKEEDIERCDLIIQQEFFYYNISPTICIENYKNKNK